MTVGICLLLSSKAFNSLTCFGIMFKKLFLDTYLDILRKMIKQ